MTYLGLTWGFLPRVTFSDVEFFRCIATRDDECDLRDVSLRFSFGNGKGRWTCEH